MRVITSYFYTIDVEKNHKCRRFQKYCIGIVCSMMRWLMSENRDFLYIFAFSLHLASTNRNLWLENQSLCFLSRNLCFLPKISFLVKPLDPYYFNFKSISLWDFDLNITSNSSSNWVKNVWFLRLCFFSTYKVEN